MTYSHPPTSSASSRAAPRSPNSRASPSPLGTTPAVDGIFGPRTEVAVRALQADLGVIVDGVVGDETRSAIAAVAPILEHVSVLEPDGRLLYFGAAGSDVAHLQSLLSLAGHEAGTADGSFGSRTRAAVRALQEAAGLTPDGVVGRNTRAALLRQLGAAPLLTCSG